VAKQYYEQPHEDSDVDLLIVVRESARSSASAIEVYRAWRGLCVPGEVKLVTQREVEVPYPGEIMEVSLAFPFSLEGST
jgi:hypothetical protein